MCTDIEQILQQADCTNPNCTQETVNTSTNDTIDSLCQHDFRYVT